MSTLSATLIWNGFRHPVRSLQEHRSKRAITAPAQSSEEVSATTTTYGCQSAERLERIAAYARVGYFHMEYTAGMFVVPLDVSPD